jgi:hypothetical protein
MHTGLQKSNVPIGTIICVRLYLFHDRTLIWITEVSSLKTRKLIKINK